MNVPRSLLCVVAIANAHTVRAQSAPPATLPTADTEFPAAMLNWSRASISQAANEELRLPVRATRYSSYFGIRRHPMLKIMSAHLGVDIPESSGTPVLAAASGIVTYAGWSNGYGNLVKIDHGGGIETRYAHLSIITASVGDLVQQGNPIGNVGSTGRSTGAHLHFEFRDHGHAVDPLQSLGTPISTVAPIIPITLTAPQIFVDQSGTLPTPELDQKPRLLPLCNAEIKNVYCRPA